MNSLISTMAITIFLGGILLILSTTPHAANASSCSEQAAVNGLEAHNGFSAFQGSCSVSTSAHANPTTGGAVFANNPHGSTCTSEAASKSGQSIGSSGGGSCNSGTSSHSP